MQPWMIITLVVVTVVLLAAVIGLYFWGKRLEKRQAQQREQMDAAAQQVTMLIIDKKRMKLKEAGLPQVVMDQTNWYLKRTKLPVVKAKVGPRVMTLIADEAVFAMIPTKKEVKATVSGIYITAVRGIHGAIEKPQGKKTFREKMSEKYRALTSGNKDSGAKTSGKKTK